MLSRAATAVLVLAFSSSVAADRTFTVTNACSYTIWPALFTSGGTAPTQATGWAAPAGSSVSFTVNLEVENWNGRIWGRTDCSFDGSTLPTTCSTGGCNGGLECATSGGTGVPPATLAEFNLNDSSDWYDISNVDGFNLPLSITNNVGCTEPSCSTDIDDICPPALAVTNSASDVVGCVSACAANLDGNSADSPNCCSGSYDTAATCPSSGVEYYSVFHDACPQAYAYAYDDNIALFTCSHSLGADYTITPLFLSPLFRPSSPLAGRPSQLALVFPSPVIVSSSRTVTPRSSLYTS
ncbi:hypothetical protein JCM1840_006295 [Sporobolomyces johnsonii]